MIVSLLQNCSFRAPVILHRATCIHFPRYAGTFLPARIMKQEEKSIEELLKEELPRPYDGPERDHINFPRRKRDMYPGKIRMGFIPEEWFQFFHKKTGVTGPYVFGAGLITFLLSKELFVIEHEFSTGVAMFILVYTAVKKFGPSVAAYRDKLQEEDLKEFEDIKAKDMKALEDGIAEAKRDVWCLEGNSILMNAKRENVHMQLEAEYRKRQMHIYEQVKKRLDYQMDLANAQRQMEQKHMANWIVNNVLKSITPQQEKEALQKCIKDLKNLSAAAH